MFAGSMTRGSRVAGRALDRRAARRDVAFARRGAPKELAIVHDLPIRDRFRAGASELIAGASELIE